MMSEDGEVSGRGGLWFRLLAGDNARPVRSVPSVLAADALLGSEKVRYLAVVPDRENRFPCARKGQVGVDEGWNLAKHIRQAIDEDQNGIKRSIVAVVDVPSQAYGRREELLGIFLAAAAAADAYVSARLAGHPVISLIVGHAISGGFLAHGAQSNRILALNDPGVMVHAMAKNAAARVTRRTVEELDEMAEKVAPMSYKITDYAKLGILYRLIEGVSAEAPASDHIEQVRRELIAAIADARTGPKDLSGRFTSEGARQTRGATLEVRRRLREKWS